jgi:hypothetical protein
MLKIEMPISHICPTCLTEFARVRAVPDPHYGLPVVVCPGCNKGVVRVRHPDRAYWREMRRLRKSLQRLWLTLLFTALSTGAVIGMCFWVLPELTSRSHGYIVPDWADPAIASHMGGAAMILLLSGCIARAIYPHRSFITVLTLFVVLIPFFLFIDLSIGSLMIFVRDLVGADGRIWVPSTNDIARRMRVLPIAMLVFVGGLWMGTFVNGLIARSEHKRISRIRRRLRRRQSRLD